MVEENELKQVIKFKTGDSWGFHPLPETTFKLITDGAEDKVQGTSKNCSDPALAV